MPLDGERVAFLARSGFNPDMVARYATCAGCAQRLLDEARGDSRGGISAEERLRRRQAASGLPAQYWDLRLGALTPTPAQAAAVLSLNGFVQEGASVFLCGPVGTGKTTMAAAAVAEALQHRMVRWTSVPGLVLGLADAFGSDRHKRAQEVLMGQDPLCLDDLGQERPNERVREVLFAAIADRLNAGIGLVITSNLLPSQLGERYGTWLPSRLQGHCATHLLAGPDRRLHPHDSQEAA